MPRHPRMFKEQFEFVSPAGNVIRLDAVGTHDRVSGSVRVHGLHPADRPSRAGYGVWNGLGPAIRATFVAEIKLRMEEQKDDPSDEEATRAEG
uniref:Uncharacterized protein n=1 Tax=viral metagenome TaxID=1070528 RepID=A0A6M3J292_9ZZZZ